MPISYKIKQQLRVLAVIPLFLLLSCMAHNRDSFTIVVLPDTQLYSESYPATFQAQTSWIRDKHEKNHIVFVAHVGDITNKGWEDRQWQNAKAAMKILDGVVPYGVVPGNHDLGQRRDDTTKKEADPFVQYFGPRTFAGRPWYLGASPDGHSSLQAFTADGRTFLHLGLDCNANDAALAWAEARLAEHPDDPVILTTHNFLNPGIGRMFERCSGIPEAGNSSFLLWKKFIQRHPRIFLIFSGHYRGEWGQLVYTQSGPLIELQADYQGREKGGDGWLRLVTFVPRENKIRVRTYSPTLGQFETDGDSQFDVPLDFHKLTGR